MMHTHLLHYTGFWTIIWIIAAACILSTVRFAFGRLVHKHRDPLSAPAHNQNQTQQKK
ncbi:hypothetical protein [Entomobacter blattae]|nr:hypothetical protein [Entomobacter blattae]